MSKLTLEQVRDCLRTSHPFDLQLSPTRANEFADAIDAELKARGEAVGYMSKSDIKRLRDSKDSAGMIHAADVVSKPAGNIVMGGQVIPVYTAPPAPKITNEALVKLARRCLWLAYVWNDHNFDAAHVCARKTAEDVGIESFEEANTWLQALKETP